MTMGKREISVGYEDPKFYQDFIYFTIKPDRKENLNDDFVIEISSLRDFKVPKDYEVISQSPFKVRKKAFNPEKELEKLRGINPDTKIDYSRAHMEHTELISDINRRLKKVI